MEGPGEGVALRDQLADAVGRDRFDLWLDDDTQVQFDPNGVVDIVFTSTFICDTVRRNIGGEITTAAQRLYGIGTRVVLRVDESAPTPQPTVRMAKRPAKPAEAPVTQVAPSQPIGGTFDTLVAGRANELAVRAGVQLAAGKHVGGPLVIYGPPGTGKTHLLSAIKHACRFKSRRARVLSLTSEQFVGTYVDALRRSGLPSFRQKYRAADLLILDDLHFMAGKRATLEELQHTIDRITAAGGSVVVASCQEPGQIANLPEEMLSRLRAGLCCEVAPADYATRVEVARRRCHEYKLPVSEAAVARLAAGVSTGVRELLGAIERLRARHELLGETIDTALVDQTTSEINYQTVRRVAMDDIQRVVCDHFGIDSRDLRSSSRNKSVTEPRMLAMWLARKYTQAGWREIGEYFGGRRHSTVISAHRRIEAQMGRDSTAAGGKGERNLEQAVGQIETKLRMA